MRFILAALVTALCHCPVWAETPSFGMIEIDTEEGPRRFHVEIADEPGEHMRGLMYREALAEKSGMLFLYDRPRPAAFWMKNTIIPLDMLFIEASGRIAKVAAKTTPLSLEPVKSGVDVIGILEIGGGDAERLGIEAGDTARWTIFPMSTE